MSRPRLLLAFVTATLLVVWPAAPRADDLVWVRFEQYLEALRQQAGIPGMSGLILKNGQRVWEGGFGFQNVEDSIRAAPDTPYHVAGLTQTLAAAMLLECVEDGRASLDDPIRLFAPSFPDPGATVRHVITHTSEGGSGTVFKYDMARLALATPAIDACSGRPYAGQLEMLLERLGMSDSVPGVSRVQPSPSDGDPADAPTRERYARVLQRLARPYRLDKGGKPVASVYPSNGIDAGAGLVSTARDLARFDAALDEGAILDDATLQVAWSNPVTAEGRSLPHGLGWFVQPYAGERVVWQFGLWPDATSSLIVKVPNRNLTLILLANSDGLSAPFQLGAGDVTSSLFARLFLRLFL